jgi:hypothetical protein
MSWQRAIDPKPGDTFTWTGPRWKLSPACHEDRVPYPKAWIKANRLDESASGTKADMCA